MKVSVLGLGYVGAVSAGCLAKEGHVVIGVDPNITKVELINQGKSPIIENGIGEIIAETVSDNRLRATTDIRDAVMNSSISLICVGTPSQISGNLDLSFVRRVCEQIGEVLREKDDYHVVVVRSTMLPGSVRSTVIPTVEEASGKIEGTDFGICVNPEFLREGVAVFDYNNPPKTVIGESNSRSGDVVAPLYEHLRAPMIRTDIASAEMVKFTDNVWHALKVCFANEIGSICKGLGLDSHRVMDIFTQDTKLNISAHYLRPGFAFGGSCLPKDVRALTFKGRALNLELPVLNAINPSNERHVQRGIDIITSKGKRRIGVLGVSFKAGTDDLRESPLVDLIERLIGKGFELKIFDRNVNLAKIVGANRDYILNHIPHISRLLTESMEEVLEHAEVVVLGNPSPEFDKVPDRLKAGQLLVDLVRIRQSNDTGEGYDGICW